jgi:group I intron endonuclease
MHIEITPNSGVYCIRHIGSNAIYIGASSNLHKREWQHFYDLSRGVHGNKNMQACYDASPTGNSAFEFATIECCERADLSERERHWIGAFEPEFNDRKGGGLYIRTAETKRRMSAVKIGEKHPRFAGLYRTPFGEFVTCTQAEKAMIINPIHFTTILKNCKNADRPITRKMYAKSPYLQAIGETAIGKTWRELGFWFEPK